MPSMHFALLGDKIESACLVHTHTCTARALDHQCGLHSGDANVFPPPTFLGHRVGKLLGFT